MSNLAAVTFTAHILPALIIVCLAVLLAMARWEISNFEDETLDLMSANKSLSNANEVAAKHTERILNERREIEIHLYGEIRHASIEDICARIDGFKPDRVERAEIKELQSYIAAFDTVYAVEMELFGRYTDIGKLGIIRALRKTQRFAAQQEMPYGDIPIDPTGLESGFDDPKA